MAYSHQPMNNSTQPWCCGKPSEICTCSRLAIWQLARGGIGIGVGNELQEPNLMVNCGAGGAMALDEIPDIFRHGDVRLLAMPHQVCQQYEADRGEDGRD